MDSLRRGEARTQASGFEERLLARFCAGEPEAIGALFDLYVDRVFAFALHMLGNRSDAEEATSEVFLRAFERAATFRGEGAFRGWLFRIARNLCLDMRRQPRLLLLEPEAEERISDAGRGALVLDTKILVQEALKNLSEEHRLVLLLCDVQEWDASEAAEILERSVAATKSLLYRARRELRLWLQEDRERGDTAR